MKNKFLPIIVVALIIVAGGTYFLKNGQTKEGVRSVVLTEDGFTPETLSIKKGDTVTFSTTTGKFFWPASNPHPTHTDYPEFDPKDAVAANKTWNFKFEKVGSWGYHDHLAPYYTGTIKVSP